MKGVKTKQIPWTGNTFAYAAKQGSLENIKWLITNGCPWGINTFDAAAYR